MSPPDFSHLKPSDRVERVPRVGDVVPMYVDGSGGRAQVTRVVPVPGRPGSFEFYMDRDWSSTKLGSSWVGHWEVNLWPAEMLGVQPPTGTTKVDDRPTTGKTMTAKPSYVPPTGDPEFPSFCLRCNGHSYMGLNRVEHKPGHGKGCPAR